MRELKMDRRRFLGGLGAGLALSTLPSRALAAFDGHASWPAVSSFIPQFVAEHPIPGALIALGRGQHAPEFYADGVVALGSETLVGPEPL